MRKTWYYFFLAASLLFFSCQEKTSTGGESLTGYVDPFIGTADHGHVFLGANVPFGLVQLGPSNVFEGWDWCSGYNYKSNTIVGFSHMHLSGTGIGDLNDILVMPTTGKLWLTEGTIENPDNGYLSTFRHENEICKPGYYSVLLDKYNIKAELTATERTGFHRYTVSRDDTLNIIINLDYGVGWDRTTDAGMTIVSDSAFAGYRYSTGWAKDQRVYFTAEFSEPVLQTGFYQGGVPVNGMEAKGAKLVAVCRVPVKKDKPLLLKVALSPVSTENARLNMMKENTGWDFDEVVKQADEKWNKELAKINISTPQENTKKIFYTALYHSMFAPSVFNDVNGDYLGTDKKIYKNAEFTNYTTFSLWDTYRALHPLFTITQPQERINDMIQSMLAIYKQQGRLPVWHLMGNETNTMNGNHSIPVIVDAFLKGIKNYDTTLAYEAVKNTSLQTHEGMNYLQDLQFIPADTLIETVSNALEYAIDDWCVAQFAKAMHKEDDYDYFLKRSALYTAYFDASTGFMRARLMNGRWKTPFDPMQSIHMKGDFVEGNAWQYTWLVPQDPYGLIRLFGGDGPFSKKLDSLFIVKGDMGAEASIDISGLIGMYAQGNEPNHHIPYLYAYCGQPWKTAELVRQIADTFYTARPNGLCGNEDLGQMSAWYVFSSMGFYPVHPAGGEYVLGSPLVDEVSIHTEKNKRFTLKAIGNSDENIYIQKAEYNGKEYSRSWITQEMIMNGGELKLYMGSTPSATWGVARQDRPF